MKKKDKVRVITSARTVKKVKETSSVKKKAIGFELPPADETYFHDINKGILFREGLDYGG